MSGFGVPLGGLGRGKPSQTSADGSPVLGLGRGMSASKETAHHTVSGAMGDGFSLESFRTPQKPTNMELSSFGDALAKSEVSGFGKSSGGDADTKTSFGGGFRGANAPDSQPKSGFGAVQESQKSTGFGGPNFGNDGKKTGFGGGFGGISGGGEAAKTGFGGGFGSSERSSGGAGFGEGLGGGEKSGGGSSFGGGFGGSGGDGCRSCGGSGHFARECPNAKCRKCEKTGHIAKDCPNPASGGGGGFGASVGGSAGGGGGFGGSSGGFGAATGGFGTGGGGFGTGGGGGFGASGGGGGGDSGDGCRSCGESGHFARECPNAKCRKCEKPGHFAKDCSVVDKCRRCGEEGHFAKECPKPQKCYNCGQDGHMSSECTNERVEGAGPPRDPERPPPVTYIPNEKTDEDLIDEHMATGINFSKYEEIPVERTGKALEEAISSFSDLKLALPEILLENVKRLEYSKPTPIQKHALPVIINGRDLLGCAQTGSGKTAAFLLPILRYLLTSGETTPEDEAMEIAPKALIVAPTRELVHQIFMEAKKFGKGSVVKSAELYGGVNVRHQVSKARGCDILVGSPGRLTGMIQSGDLSLKKIKFFVLDEADKMLEQGFRDEIERMLGSNDLPKAPHRQTMMFSATFPDDIQQLAKDHLTNFAMIAVGKVGGANRDIIQEIREMTQAEKNDALITLLKEELKMAEEAGEPYDKKTLVFVERKRQADFVGALLSQEDCLKATTIHGDRSQQQREIALHQFKKGKCQVLVATSVAGRGLDITGVDHVINYDMPQTIEEYVHRIGRTGRIGNPGRASSFYDRDTDSGLAVPLVKTLAEAGQIVPTFLEAEAERGGPMPGGNSKFGGGNVKAVVDDEEEW